MPDRTASSYLPSARMVGASCISFLVLALLLVLAISRTRMIPFDTGNIPSLPAPPSEVHPTTRVQFSPHLDYKSLSPSHDRYWNDLLTPNGGFLIEVDEESGSTIRHGIAMFHQIHCLQMIRTALQAARPRAEKAHVGDDAVEGLHGGHADDDEHLVHCLDYLRQIVLCVADETIELPKMLRGGHYAIDGMVPHQCRDSQHLYKLSNDSPPYTPRVDRV